MKPNFNYSRWIFLMLLLAFSHLVLNAQEPCDPMECCLDNEGFEDFNLGPFPSTPPFQSPGFYASSGSITVVSEGHNDPQSVEYVVGTGTSLAYTGGSGVAGPVPAMLAGNEYCVEFCLFVVQDNGPITIALSTSSGSFFVSNYSFTGSWETITVPTYTPAVDHPEIFFNISGSLEVPVRLDNICIDQQQDGGEGCMADFELEGPDECGVYCFNNRSCGEGLSYTWSIRNGISVEVASGITEDFCYDFQVSDTYTIVLTIIGADGCEDEYSQELDIVVENDPFVFDCSFSETITAQGGSDCTYDYTIPFLNWSGGVGVPTISVLLNSSTYNEGDVVNLTTGTYSIVYLITGECGLETTCTYVITIECEGEELPDHCGWMVATCYGTEAIPDVAVLMDTRFNSAAPQGQDWNDATLGVNRITSIHPTMWNANDIGQVFGIAVDDFGGIYLGASRVYNNVFELSTPLPKTGPAGSGGIYFTDFNNVNVTTPLVTTINVATSNTVGTNSIPNTGGTNNGIGNIAYDKTNDQLFATNLEDGRLYRIDRATGNVLSIFDPLGLDGGAAGLVPVNERIFGVGVYTTSGVTKVYYAVSNSVAANRAIYSIALDASGEFLANDSGGNLFVDVPQSSVLELTNIPGTQLIITDIAFSSQGEMLLAERGHPHASRTFEYTYVGGSWIIADDFLTGRGSGQNTAGGVDYGEEEMNGVINQQCDALVWSSVNFAETLINPCCVYGVQGSSSSGNSSNQATNYANDYFIDFNGAYGTLDKNGVGDVELFHCGCPADVSQCDSLMVMSRPFPEECFDQSIITGNPCTFEFDPVCGCDGVTYGNACEAQEAGITTFVQGECNGENTPELSGLCCYSLDIKNNYGSSIVELEVEMLTPEWIFNTTTLSAPFTFGSCGSLNNKFCVQDATAGFIPSGISFDAIATCFAPVVTNPTTQPIVEFKWKELIGDEEFVITCRDTLDFICELPPIDSCLVIASDTISCLGEDNPLAYEYCFTITNNSGQDVGQIVLDDLSAGFTFAPLCTNSRIEIPTPNPLPDGATSQQICVEVKSSIPITQPQDFCLKMGLIAADGSDCCHSPVEICKEIEPCCDPCENKSVTFNSIGQGEDECCYSVDITNECVMPYFTKIEAVINTPGVCFGSHVMGAAHAGNWIVTSTPQSICMEPLGGVIDQSSYQDLFSFCLDKIDDPSQANPTITLRWFAIDPMTGEQVIVCEDIEETECPNAENDCLIITDGDLVCVPDSNKYRYTFQVKNTSNPGFTADKLHLVIKNNTAWQPVPSGPVIVLNTPLAPGDSTVITTCIAGPAFPAPFSDFVFGYRLQNTLDGDCCFESVCDTIPVPPCMDCCDEDRLDMELDDYLNTLLVNNCKVSFGPVELDTCVALSINWGDGSGDSYHMDSTACKVYDQSGTFNVCVQFEVFPEMGILPCYQKDTCLTIEIVDCPSDCFSVIDIEAKEVVCDTTDCYDSPFCQPWLVSEIGTIFCGNFFQPYVQKATFAGNTVFVIYYPNIEGALVEIYSCDGTLLQSCAPTGGGGQSCNPFAGIDITTDLSNVQTIWMCGDPLPTLDANCSSGMSVEYCVKIMNQSTSAADKVTLNPILPSGATISPSVINGTITSGGMSTITFTVNGPLVPGVDTKIDAQLMGVNADGSEWMCNDTICLPTPVCPPPPVDECCQDESAFDALVIQGLQITDLGDCTYQVCANQFDDCHWFWTASPDWGDGTPVLPSVTQSDSPNNCWTHIYSVGGPYTITLNVEEQNADGDACWDGQMQDVVDCPDDSEECCQDESAFDALVNQGLQITDLGDCTYQVCANQFDDCHWFWTASPDWGDGTPVLPSVTQSDSPNNCWTHIYSVGGPYTITLNVEEQNANGDACWDGQMQDVVECPDDPEECCEDESSFDVLVNQGLQITDLGDCTYQVCANQFDDCHWFWTASPDWGDGTPVLPSVTQSDSPNNCWTHIYSVGGPYTITLNVEEQNADGDACWDGQMQDVVDCPDDPMDCCDMITPSDIDADNTDALNSISVNGCEVCIDVDHENCVEWIIDWGDGNATAPSSTDVNQLCHDYIITGNYTITITGSVYDDNGVICHEAINSEMVDTDCTPDDCCDQYEASDLSQDIANALSSNVLDGCELCINGEFPDCVNWYVDWGDGSTSIGTSMGNDTRCLTYDFPGTYTACLFAFVIDMNGDTCLSETQCIDVSPDCDTDCCDISEEEYDDLFNDLIDFDFEGDCDTICFYPDGEFCDLVTIDFGDGTSVGPIGGDDEICHVFGVDGIYNVCVTMYRPEDFDPSINCIERDTCFDVTIDCDPDGDCCDDYLQADLEQDISDALATLSVMECNYCIDLDFPDCVQWQLNWGDGSTSPGGSGITTLCHDYTVDSTITIILSAGVSDGIGSQCIEALDSVVVDVNCESDMPDDPDPGCDPNSWLIPNGLTPNGDGFNEELIFYNTEDCTINLKIYNRWGQMVFVQDDYDKEWHGQSENGENLPDGTYYLLIGTDSQRDGQFDQFITKYIDLRRE